MFYVYQNHLYGHAYYTNGKKAYKDLYCEGCGDSDILIEMFDTEKEAEDYVEKFNEGDVE